MNSKGKFFLIGLPLLTLAVCIVVFIKSRTCSVGIIGGADGPTVIYLTGFSGILLPVILILVAILLGIAVFHIVHHRMFCRYKNIQGKSHCAQCGHREVCMKYHNKEGGMKKNEKRK